MLVEIWSDVVCPWCAVGKARFDKALATFPHADQVEVVWRSFELDTNAPAARSTDHAGHLAAKYGMTVERAEQMIEQMTQTAAADGLDFRFDIAKGGNTFDAHRLLHLAKARGLQHELGERLFQAYFTEGEPIGEIDALQRVATSAGLDEVEVKELLVGDRFADAVRADEALARQYGISGVPFFVVDGKYGVSGAQSPETLRGVLDTAWAETNPLTMVTSPATADVDAGICDDDTCVV